MVEQLICNQQVRSSILLASSRKLFVGSWEYGDGVFFAPNPELKSADCFFGEVPERPKGADCKSAGVCLRRFEPFPLHHVKGSK